MHMHHDLSVTGTKSRAEQFPFPKMIGVAGFGALSPSVLEQLTELLQRLDHSNGSRLFLLQGPADMLARLHATCRKAEVDEAYISSLIVEANDAVALLRFFDSCDEVVLCGPEFDEKTARDLVKYAQESGCTRAVVLKEAGGTDHSWPDQPVKSGWLPVIFQQIQVPPTAPISVLHSRADELANQTAPISRKWQFRITMVQWISVGLPFSWFVITPYGLPAWAAATMGSLGVLSLLTTTWWLRWRGMQKTWSRSRLLAEVTRSIRDSSIVPASFSLLGFEAVPELRGLLWHSARASALSKSDGWLQTYISDRLAAQEKHFAEKQAAAEKLSASLTRWSGILLDLTLAIAVAGMVLAIGPFAAEWRWSFGGDRLQVTIGVLLASLPLAVILIQNYKLATETERRSARYQQQRNILRLAQQQLAAIDDEPSQLRIISDVERALRSEVVEWYFQSISGERVFDRLFRRLTDRLPILRKTPADPANAVWLGSQLISRSRALAGFLGRVIFDRVAIGVASAAIALMWVSLNRLQHPSVYTQLCYGALLRGVHDHALENQLTIAPERAKNGLVIMAHGLHSGPDRGGLQIANAIAERLGVNSPEIGILDWANAAKNLGYSPLITDDIAAIRPQARLVGDALSLSLVNLIEAGSISSDKPIYLIGHSAGGFVVARAALRLHQLGYGKNIYVTILDTPAADEEIRSKLATAFAGHVDYYRTSVFGDRVEGVPGIHFALVSDTLRQINQVTAHRHAISWFLTTIADRNNPEGFNRSPLITAQSSSQ